MTSLNITFSPEAAGRFRDTLTCLGKFSEAVSIEVQRTKLLLTALNSSKSAYCAFIFDSNRFFERYRFVPAQSLRKNEDTRFSCRIYNKALISVFKARGTDFRERETAIERCELSLQDSPEKAECRLIIKMFCRHGVVKTYKLTYESVEAMHALFDQSSSTNQWSISSKLLKEFIEYFGPKTEFLDIYSENGRATFTSYTEKIMDGKQILKQPLHTSVAIDTAEFESFSAEEKVHISISVKDFKAIVTHADTLQSTLAAHYSQPTRPMQLSYTAEGITSEFTVMTIGNFRASSVTPSIPKQDIAAQKRQARSATVSPQKPAPAIPNRSVTVSSNAPQPPQRAPSPPPSRLNLEEESLFLPEDEMYRRWDSNFTQQNEDEDTIGWDASADQSMSRSRLSNPSAKNTEDARRRVEGVAGPNPRTHIPPTQNLSEVHGFFDD